MPQNDLGRPDLWAAVLAFVKSGAAGPLLAAAAGSVISLAFLDKLTPRGRVAALAVGFLTAVYVAPLLTGLAAWKWDLPFLAALRNGIHFLVSVSAMAVLPPLLAWLRDVARDPLKPFGGAVAALLKPKTAGSAGGE